MKSLIVKGIAGGLLALLVSNALYKCVLYDLAVVAMHPATRENTAGKRVLITGSSRGIGEALALVYSELGAQVTLHSRYSASLEKVARDCRSRGSPGVHSVSGDMSQEGVASRVVEEAAAAMGGLDVVVVNHADSAPFESLGRSFTGLTQSPDRLQKAMRTNLLSYIEASVTSLPHLETSNGSLLLVSSIITRLPAPYCYEYCFAKRALDGFLGSLRQELAINGSRIHAGLVVPGIIDTQLARTIMANAPDHEATVQYNSPMSTAWDIASMPVARNRELVTPWTMRLPALIGSWAPEMIESQMRWRVQ